MPRLRHGQTTFTVDEIAVLRICEAHGWDEEKWRSLDDDYRERLMANDLRRQKNLRSLVSGFEEKIKAEEPIDLTSYISILLEQIR